MTLVTIAQVRTKSGAPVSLMSDDEVESTINEVEKEIINIYKIYTTPTKVVEIRDGQNSQDVVVNLPNDETVVRYPYLWKMLAVNIQDTSLDLEYVQINPEKGTFRIELEEGTAYSYLYGYKTRLKYLSGFMERTTRMTESSADVVAGTSIAIAVDDETIFSVNDWVVIEGLDGNIEAAKITATDTNEITVDQLVQTHESESVITKLQTDESLTQLVLYSAAVAIATNAVGGTYTIATGYTYPEYTVQKGVPWTHWKNNLDSNEKRRKEAIVKMELKLNAMS